VKERTPLQGGRGAKQNEKEGGLEAKSWV